MKYRPYPKYRNSGIEWLGEVPEHWEKKRLKHCVSRINMSVAGSDVDIPYTGLEHIESWTGKRTPSDELSGSDGMASLYQPGDVLFGKLRPYLAKVHAAAEHGVCTGELLVLRPRVMSPAFLKYYLLSQEFVSAVDSSTYGAKMPRASWEFIGDLPALIPVASEQQAIASFLDRETARIDALIEKKKRQIELLQEKRTALISHAVTKGLDPNVKMKDSGIEWLGVVPEHWEVASLRRTFLIQNGATPKSGEPDYWDGDVVWATPDDLGNLKGDTLTVTKRTITAEGYASCGTSLAPAGSLVLSTRAPIGHLAIAGVPLCVNQGCRCLVMNRPGSERYQYYLIFASKSELQSLGEGSTFTELSRDKLASLYLCSPENDEQHAIATFLDRETTRSDAMIEKVYSSIEKLREYRTALISAAVTGKIDVRKEVA